MGIMQNNLILVTGATGYVGGRLIPLLLERGYQVRAVGRNLDKLKGRYWSSHPNLQLAEADIKDYDSLKSAMEGCSVGYYLIHSMVREEKRFEEADRENALNFVAAAESIGLKRIIYLGGLGNEKDKLSRHLQSRREVGEILRQSTIPATIFRAAMIIGAGSASFEILRYLVDRIPIMITPKWVRTPCQPISIINVLEYLVQTLEVKETIGHTYDIGGPRITTYQELMSIYADVAHLKKRIVIPVAVLSPRLSSYWIGLVTPLPPAIGKPLAEGLSNKVICEDTLIRELIPQRLLDYREAIQRAVDKINQHTIETSWSDAGKIPPAEWIDSNDPNWAGGTLLEANRSRVIKAPISNVWKTVTSIGGKQGWYSASWLWKMRGMLDKLFGGVGLRRGRRDPEKLQVGDAVDFWRVKILKAPTRLVLVAEMKVPGQAILEFKLTYIDKNSTRVEQTAKFFPNGLWGIIYWYLLSPFHLLIFSEMIRNTEKLSIRQEEVGDS